MRRKHTVYRVSVGSLEDEKLKDRDYWDNRRWVRPQSLPERASYLIEASARMADKKALKLASEDGIPHPILRGAELVSPL